MELVIFTALPFLLALLTPVIINALGRQGLIAIVTGSMALMFGGVLLQLPIVNNGDIIQYEWQWAPQLGLTLSFYLDGLALLFAGLVTGVGIAVFYYAGHYFDELADVQRFYRWLLVFTGAMLWLVLAGNLLVLFIAWELTSITSFMLIGFKGYKEEEARRGALQALMITGGGGLALIVGLLLIGNAADSMSMADVLNTSLVDHPYYTAIVILIALAAFTKSAQFPFHFWLPGAMSAPSPASAFLHSATMVKAGVYLLARFYPTLGNSDFWALLLTATGIFTLFMASVLAVRHRDLKGLLAYTTIAQLGTLVALIGLPDYAGFKALMVGILAHALYKAPLFLSAGIIDHATGTRIVDKLGGLRKQLPGLAVVVGLACLSMAGLIPMLGFVGKETVLEAFINDPLPLALIVISAILTVAVAGIIFYDVFVRQPQPDPAHDGHDTHDAHDDHHFHQPTQPMLYGPALLAGVGSITGLLLPQTIIPYIDPAVPKDFSLYLFPGFNTAFMLSTFAIVAGLALFAVRGLWLKPFARVPLPSGEGIYNSIVDAVEWFADQLLRTQNGKLRYYLVVILGSVAALMLVSGILPDSITGHAVSIELESASEIVEVLLIGAALMATFASVVFRNQVLAALALGVMGYAVAGIFLLEPAPDVALVQFLVETLGTILVIIMIGRISGQYRVQLQEQLWKTTRRGVWRDIAIATIVGATVGLFALNAITNRPDRDTIASWHIENAYPQTGVTDVVASILGDFRATDTLLEITVFGMAALGVLTLLTMPSAKELLNGLRTINDDDIDDTPSLMNTPFARMVAMLALPAALLVAFTHVLYAGENPGDGFTAGVIGGLGVALWYIVYGYDEAKRRLRWLRAGRLVGIGLTVALINALLPFVFGREFFAITKITGIDAPAGLHLASTLIFETGIFLAVFGGASIIMEAIAHPGETEEAF